MKTSYRNILLYIFVTLLILFLVTKLIITPYYKRLGIAYESIKNNSNEVYYYYSNSDGTDIRDGIYLFELSKSDSLIQYYKSLNDSVEPIANFQGGLINRKEPLYIIEYYGIDSAICKVIDVNNHSYYVYKTLLHSNRANE